MCIHMCTCHVHVTCTCTCTCTCAGAQGAPHATHPLAAVPRFAAASPNSPPSARSSASLDCAPSRVPTCVARPTMRSRCGSIAAAACCTDASIARDTRLLLGAPCIRCVGVLTSGARRTACVRSDGVLPLLLGPPCACEVTVLPPLGIPSAAGAQCIRYRLRACQCSALAPDRCQKAGSEGLLWLNARRSSGKRPSRRCWRLL